MRRAWALIADLARVMRAHRLGRRALKRVGQLSRRAKSGASISVVMTSCNKMPHIVAAVESVLTQGGADWELVIWDDGSTDGTRDFLNGLKHPRVRVIFSEHKGQLEALKGGVAASTGDYVVRLDADDELCRGAIDVLRLAIAGKGEVYYFDLLEISERSRLRNYIEAMDFDRTSIIKMLLNAVSSPVPDHACWRRDFIGLVLDNYVELNVPYYLPLLKEASVVPTHVNFPVYRYRVYRSNFLSDKRNHGVYWDGMARTIHYVGTQVPADGRPLIENVSTSMHKLWKLSGGNPAAEGYYRLWTDSKGRVREPVPVSGRVSVALAGCSDPCLENAHVFQIDGPGGLRDALRTRCIDFVVSSSELRDGLAAILAEMGLPLIPVFAEGPADLRGAWMSFLRAALARAAA